MIVITVFVIIYTVYSLRYRPQGEIRNILSSYHLGNIRFPNVPKWKAAPETVA